MNADQMIQRTEDYRSGYSCGYSDGKKGTRMRDKDAAELFFGINGVPDVFSTPEVEILQRRIQSMCETLKAACDRSWKDETPEQIAIIAANAIHWREFRRMLDCRTNLKSTGYSSAKYGNCEICHKPVSDVFILANPVNHIHTFGHQSCLGTIEAKPVIPGLWHCLDCGFGFDAAHTDNDGGYHCPACAEIALREILQSVRPDLVPPITPRDIEPYNFTGEAKE